jgi:hypothetical protein
MVRKILTFIFAACLFFISCKKEIHSTAKLTTQLYPLTAGNLWIYVDSFYDESGTYYGKDTFLLKPAKTIPFNNQMYTPITDQYDEAIFTVRSDDSTVFMLESPAEMVMFSLPVDNNQTAILNSYYGGEYRSAFYTEKIITTNYPSYRIVITKDDGQWFDYRQQEMFFTIGKGIIKGHDLWKNSTGDIYTSDSYNLVSYNIQ